MNRVTYKKLSAREIALYLLSRVELQGAYADRILVSPRVLNLQQRDQAFVRELLLGVLRWKLHLDRIIDIYHTKSSYSLNPDIRNILRYGLFQMIFMNSVPVWAAVNESVYLAAGRHGKGAAGLVNAILRRFDRDGEPPLPVDPEERLSVETSNPYWLVKRWCANYGFDTAESICRATSEKHPIFIRTNGGRITTQELVCKLEHEHFNAVEVSKMPGYVAVSKGHGLFETKAFKDGLFTVQDPSAGVASFLLKPQQGESIVDLCAAPGGKTTHCAEMMGDCGQITAVDIHPSRLGLVRSSAQRLGFTSIVYVEGDASIFGREDNILYDRVLIDVPCSGTGVFSKRPDMKWRIQEDDLGRLASVQREFLENASHLVKPGGILVYSTCSIEHEENEDVIRWFLDHHKEFSIEHEELFHDFERDGCYLILPHLMDGSGAFAAKLKRV